MESAFIEALTAQVNLSSSSQLAHWNCEGEQFFHFHLLFERVYETASAKIDTLAEQARGQGVEIPAKIFNSVPEIEWETLPELSKEIEKLVDDFSEALDSLHEECDKKSHYGVLNVVEDIMSDCNTLKYLLGSVNKEFD